MNNNVDLTGFMTAFIQNAEAEMDTNHSAAKTDVLPANIELGVRYFDGDATRDDGSKGVWQFEAFSKDALGGDDAQKTQEKLFSKCRQIARKNQDKNKRRVFHAISLSLEVTEFLTRKGWNMPEGREVMRRVIANRPVPTWMLLSEWQAAQEMKAEMGGQADIIDNKNTTVGLDGQTYVQVWKAVEWEQITALFSPGDNGEPPVFPPSLLGKRVWIEVRNLPSASFIPEVPATHTRWNCQVRRDDRTHDDQGNEIPVMESFDGNDYLIVSDRKVGENNVPVPKFNMWPVRVVADNKIDAQAWVAQNADVQTQEGSDVVSSISAEATAKQDTLNAGYLALLDDVEAWEAVAGAGATGEQMWVETITSLVGSVEAGTPSLLAVKEWKSVTDTNNNPIITAELIANAQAVKSQVYA